ncbi:hypothetical protein [Sutcliffiella halmapala]|uniref:hypothetical protein n=1 Tax=Sutcliffiella halmapala TaxID=79882 RepID=UPI0009959215|nr:hypothetical protein [Sutcliffiella halmapala]
MEVLQTKLKVTQNDCEEMMRNLPATRFAYWILILSIPFAILLGYFHHKRANLAIAENAEHLSKLNNDAILLGIILGFILYILCQFFWKYAVKSFGKKLYKTHKKRNAMSLDIRFDKKSQWFVFSGREQEKYTKNAKLTIVSTPNNYIFYIGKGLYAGKLFLPKHGDEAQKLIVKEIIDILHNKENIPIRTSKK